MPLDTEWRRGFLCRALSVVAASAPDQRGWLEKHGVGADEIALDLEHGFRLAPQLVEQGALSRESLADVGLIDAVFDEMTRDRSTDWWAVEALAVAPGWARARELAGRVLAREGVARTALPDIRVIR
ncbi:hypothetical protein PV371_11535 [Streptomyces sp. TX20-6-3]|uniref:hypothetical protein n=1 Tax=Streptomyces sp. TX20-6-3 TaxID=3028705 RepID=UPI0029BF4EED|nr:hypothetical protein [Streptomyces sp. TX20-6-3]MDX2560279.1 hypothetical protein [Streptomyces sp. TX20-6-3]